MPLAQAQETLYSPIDKTRRGIGIYTLTQLLSITGRGKGGERITGDIEQPIFYLTIDERIQIFRLSTPVFGVVTSRMNSIAGLKWNVMSEKEQEDVLASRYKNIHQVVTEFEKSRDIKYIVAKVKLKTELMTALPELLPDFSNFNQCLFRWSRNLKKKSIDEADRVKAWLTEPNITDKWEDFVKKYIFDMLVHGAVAIFKEKLGSKLENFYILPGGMVIPLKTPFVGGYQAYVQMIYGNEPLIYFNDEISYGTYMPTTARAYGMVPLEALINKVSETLLFDKLMAEQADGTRPPEKMVIITDQNPFGDMDKEYGVPIDENEQARIEQKLNTPKKNAVMTFSGNGVSVVDLSRENTMALQTQRQKDIREEVALVFNASNMEMGLTGSEGTSGRSTSEVQQEITQQRGIKPLVQKLETQINRDILPYRFGTGFIFKFEADKNEREKAEIMQIKMASGLYSVNEIRKDDLNLDPFSDAAYDEPAGSQKQQPDGSIANPLNMKGMM